MAGTNQCLLSLLTQYVATPGLNTLIVHHSLVVYRMRMFMHNVFRVTIVTKGIGAFIVCRCGTKTVTVTDECLTNSA